MRCAGAGAGAGSSAGAGAGGAGCWIERGEGYFEPVCHAGVTFAIEGDVEAVEPEAVTATIGVLV